MNCTSVPKMLAAEPSFAPSPRTAIRLPLCCLLLLLLASFAYAAAPEPLAKNEEVLVTATAVEQYPDRLTVALRTEPKTLNPVTALDGASRDVIGRMVADLIH